MSNTNNPLEALKPLHQPDGVSWWPPAPGWWILLAILILATLLFLFRRHKMRLQRLAMQELNDLQQQNLTFSATANQVNQLLKRYALVCFPQQKVAGLSGKNWLRFLRDHSPEHEFTRAGKLLLDIPYQRSAEKNEANALFDFARSWIKLNKPGVTR